VLDASVVLDFRVTAGRTPNLKFGRPKVVAADAV
jgi:hypothetical protein